MLSRAEIERRLKQDSKKSLYLESRGYREALETAQQLGEWLQRLCAFWYLGGPLMQVPIADVDEFYARIQAWLEGKS